MSLFYTASTIVSLTQGEDIQRGCVRAPRKTLPWEISLCRHHLLQQWAWSLADFVVKKHGLCQPCCSHHSSAATAGTHNPFKTCTWPCAKQALFVNMCNRWGRKSDSPIAILTKFYRTTVVHPDSVNIIYRNVI